MGSAVETTKMTLEDLGFFLKVESVSLKNNLNLDFYPVIQEHRKEYYRLSAPHLLEENELASELQIDQKSLIIAVVYKQKVLASLRLTPRPFEIENFNIHTVNFADYQEYLEIGRLVTNPHVDQLTAAMVVRYLLCVSGLRAFGEMGCKGFVAICRPHRASFFAKFGLKILGDVYSEQRKIFYRFLAGSVSDILATTARLQENEDSLRRRLKKSLG